MGPAKYRSLNPCTPTDILSCMQLLDLDLSSTRVTGPLESLINMTKVDASSCLLGLTKLRVAKRRFHCAGASSYAPLCTKLPIAQLMATDCY